MAQRELREGARRWFNYWLRVGSGLAGAVLLGLTVTNAYGAPGDTGLRLFLRLHGLMLALIVGIVPAMAADCIARERREGTLGLLFLTPLTARGIVIGKSLAQALRVLTLWLAVLPVLTVPFLTGGVRWNFALNAAATELSAAVICLAAGLAASALAKSRHSAFLLAYILAAFFLASVAIFEGELRYPVGKTGQSPTLNELLTGGLSMATWNGAYSYVAINRFSRSAYLRLGTSSPVTISALSPRWGSSAWVVTMATEIAASVLILYLAISLGALAIQRSWKDRIASARQASWMRRFCAPIFAGWFGRRMQRSLDRNPIAWLQQYSWRARTSKWGLCGAFILIESLMFGWYVGSGSASFNFGAAWFGLSEMQHALTLILVAIFTYVGVNGFLTEKRSGALELLLVTPISVNQIILGRAWGLWKQFLPGALILLLGELGVASVEAATSQHWALGRGQVYFVSEGAFFALVVCANAFVALPIFATYCALRVRNLLGAAALTWAGLFVAWMMALCVADTLAAKMGRGLDISIFCVTIVLCNAASIALTFFLLRHSLSRRIYSF